MTKLSTSPQSRVAERERAQALALQEVEMRAQEQRERTRLLRRARLERDEAAHPG
ncbi:hypothetical protein [Parvularcula sp. LCG005]|uniref:hypothetical protein n=1 Tax=Parvularcula sp. LCG005 TaxID=3078805 RepID=UPI0029438879|nr:hypothetical protein [Parvularcula sp. LCG005]WOI53083.1 hypothetical protein RUI03_13100 [Parvularcula sp. LCG005]